MDKTTPSLAHVLLVEDDEQQRSILASILSASNYQVTQAGSAEEAMVMIKSAKPKNEFDLVFSDWKLAGLSGIDLLHYARKQDPNIGFAIATAYGTIAHAVDAIAAGADDYLAKPFQRQELLLCIEKVFKAKQLRSQNTDLSAQLSEQKQLVDLVGNSPKMQSVYQRISRVSSTDATVLITGESGTGKELAARALHQLSARKDQAFVAVNCGAIVESLAEAELFGAKKGAYTGAIKDTIGKLQSAHQGTLFLDEIGELSLQVQTRLLRFLQEGSIMPVGDTKEIELDVRVIAATHRNLPEMVKEKRFREDLYYRLNVVPIEMPALRERQDDIPVLIDFFLNKFTSRYNVSKPILQKNTLKTLLDYAWPGNVRELSNRIERLLLLGDEEELLSELSSNTSLNKEQNQSLNWQIPDSPFNWESFEKNCLEQALGKFDNNRTLAAKHLGLSYKTFVYRLNKFGINEA